MASAVLCMLLVQDKCALLDLRIFASDLQLALYSKSDSSSCLTLGPPHFLSRELASGKMPSLLKLKIAKKSER